MAAKLECEICGGKLVGKPGGVFECDSCGMEYSTEWAKQKIQEIKGTVKVEGTVEVTGKVQVEGGTVKVEGTSSKESLLKRAKMCCADKEWERAGELIEQVLNADPECGEAYLYRYLIRCRRPTPEALTALFISECKPFPTDPNLEKAEKFADEKLAAVLNRCKQECADAIEARNKLRREALTRAAAGRKELEKVKGMLACGGGHTVGLRSDGKVVAVGHNGFGQCDVNGWTGITAVACADAHTVGLCADGTVVAVGDNKYGQCNVSDWRNIVEIACGNRHTVGLRADGTVVAVGDNHFGQCNLDGWEQKNIVALCCGGAYTIGICADGRAVATGKGYNTWIKYSSNVVSVAVTGDNTVTLYTDGTVCVAEYDRPVDEKLPWKDIVAIDCACDFFKAQIVGLCADGSVVDSQNACDPVEWRNLVAVACGSRHTVGLRADGTLLAVGQNDNGQCNVSGWKLFDSLDAIERERAEMKQRAERAAEEARLRAEREAAEEQKRREARKAALAQERAALQAELANLKGLFSGKRRKELEARLTEIDNEWKGLN